MWRHTVSATIVLLFSGAWTQGDGSNKKTVQELRAAIKELRALERSLVTQICGSILIQAGFQGDDTTPFPRRGRF